MKILRDWSDKKSEILLLAYVIIFVTLGIATLPKYGLTWDEGLGNLFFGERYFHFFLSFNPAYLGFDQSDLAIHARPLNLFGSPFRENPHEFPPLADILSAASMEFLAYRVGWLDPLDAFHLPKVLLCGLLLWASFHFARPHLGTFAAFLSVLLLSTFPRLWGDMHFNPKDIPETVFFALTIFMFVTWFEKPSWRRALTAGLLSGASLAIKANALFLPAIVILGVWPWMLTTRPWDQVAQHLAKYLGHYALMVTTAMVTHILTWPYLYADLFRLGSYYDYIFSQGGRQGASTWNWDPLIQTITTMPETMLALLLVGQGSAIWRLGNARSPVLRLLVVWFFLPILRTSLPGMVNFDGIRHFEEFLPAASLLAAYGGASLVEYLAQNQPIKKMMWSTGLVLLIVANVGNIVLRYDPYEHLHYNSLVGGLWGAHSQYRFPEATDYWASSYRQGMEWINTNAPRNAVLYTPIADWVVNLTAPIWLRKDIGIVSAPALRETLASGRAGYVMFVTRTNWYNSIAKYCAQQLHPVYEIIVDRIPILQIYRLTSAEGLPQ
jgi:hypothetical protein